MRDEDFIIWLKGYIEAVCKIAGDLDYKDAFIGIKQKLEENKKPGPVTRG